MTEKVDKLERGEFIEFVKGLILNSEQYKRDNESDSYVIALDSAWGTGKSYFIDLLTQGATDDTLTRHPLFKNRLLHSYHNYNCYQGSKIGKDISA